MKWKPMLVAVAAAAVATSSAVSHAEPRQAQPTAETLYAEGQSAYDNADYSIAIAKWEESYKLSGASPLLFNLAQARRLAGDCLRALSNYRAFVQLDHTADKVALAHDWAAKLTAQCGQPTATSASSSRGHSEKLAGIASVSAGVILLGIGIALGHHAQALGEEVTNTCPSTATPPSCSWATEGPIDASGRRDATLGRVFDIVGVAGILGGAALYYFGMRNAEVSIAPVVARPGESGAVLTWSRSW